MLLKILIELSSLSTIDVDGLTYDRVLSWRRLEILSNCYRYAMSIMCFDRVQSVFKPSARHRPLYLLVEKTY